MKNKIVYQPFELLNLRHNNQYDIHLYDLLPPHQQRSLPPITPINLYPVSAFVLVHQYYHQPYLEVYPNHSLPITYFTPPTSPHPLYVSPSPPSLISPSIAIPVIKLDSRENIPKGGMPLSTLYQPPTIIQQHSYITPVSPQHNENIFKKPLNNTTDDQIDSMLTSSCSSSDSDSSSSSDIIIQIEP
ncbi:hypothetical protein G210_5756 [Candida maltosa Xu316]|uniref:Uncharacterized protein n=1 Tax=Candida maltosa (strain Xu316) TaxID=1245528 RepID=M3ISD6_CANMX|nr:hypothetical protein G210_5756 [Candida maltosa Xu316]